MGYAFELRAGGGALSPSNCELHLTSHVLRQPWQTDAEAERFAIPQPIFTFMPFAGPLPEAAKDWQIFPTTVGTLLSARDIEKSPIFEVPRSQPPADNPCISIRDIHHLQSNCKLLP